MRRAVLMAKASVIILLVSAVPLVGYILVGPADGNPIGLGILFAAGSCIAAFCFGAALVCGAMAYLRGRHAT